MSSSNENHMNTGIRRWPKSVIKSRKGPRIGLKKQATINANALRHNLSSAQASSNRSRRRVRFTQSSRNSIRIKKEAAQREAAQRDAAQREAAQREAEEAARIAKEKAIINAVASNPRSIIGSLRRSNPQYQQNVPLNSRPDGGYTRRKQRKQRKHRKRSHKQRK